IFVRVERLQFVEGTSVRLIKVEKLEPIVNVGICLRANICCGTLNTFSPNSIDSLKLITVIRNYSRSFGKLHQDVSPVTPVLGVELHYCISSSCGPRKKV